MRWTKLALLLSLTSTLYAQEVPKLLTKHGVDAIRYISMDGRFAYVKKRPGVLGLVSHFRSVDFISESQSSDFLVHTSKSKTRVIIEVIPNMHTEMNFFKGNKLLVARFGETKTKEVSTGQAPKLHLNDEWVSFYQGYQKTIVLQNLITQKKFEIKLSPKANPFFIPQVAMVSSDTVVYTDINESGVAGVISYNLISQKSSIVYKAAQSGTSLELCQGEGYLAMGEFPYEGVNRGSQILRVRTTTSFNLSSYETLYSSLDQDVGNMVCTDRNIYFIKTMNQDKRLRVKTTEAVRLELKDSKVKVLTNLKYVTQLVEMDGRVLAPLRGDFYVLEGEANLASDTLKVAPNPQEELPLEI